MNEVPPLKRLPVQLDELTYALHESSEAEAAHYLDLETGEVIRLTAEMRAEADEISASLEADVENVDAAFEAALTQRDLPGWMLDSVRLANVVQAGYGTRFIAISPVEPHEAYEDMADFVATVTNRRIHERLADAIAGRSPFRHFKDALLDYPQERERWFAFSAERQRQRALDWLKSVGIQPVEKNG